MRFCFLSVCGTALFSFAPMASLRAETIPPQPLDAVASVPRVMSVVRLDARTGRLVRAVVSTKRTDTAPSSDSGVRLLVEEAARAYDLNPELIDSVIQVESNYNPYAISPKGAQGLMQLMPETARRFGVKNAFDPKDNVEGGVKYLKFLEDTFQDDRLAIAAYNAGEKAVTKYGDVPPYKETVQYVDRVSKKVGKAKLIAKAPTKDAASAPSVEQKPVDEHRPLRLYIDQEGRLYLVTR
jgi:hypothetical protein